MDFDHKSIDLFTLSQFISNVDMSSDGLLRMVLNVIDGVEAIVCAKDISGRHYLVNSYFEKAIGISPHEVLGKTDTEIFWFNPEVAQAIREKDLQVIEGKQVVFFEQYLPDIHGEYRWFYTNKAPIFNEMGDVIAIMCLAIDITKKKAVEEKLYAATQAKNTFLAKMSHEIRTPISAISGYLNLATDCDLETCHHYFEKMTNSVDHLLNLVDDILDLSSIEANKLKLSLKPFDLINLLDSVVSNLTHKAKDNHIQIVKEYRPICDCHLFGDETRIKQIVFNLVSNAIKFSKDSPVTVRASIKPSRDKNKCNLFVLIKDEGIGMESNKKRHVFKAFEQLKSSSHYFEGTGLGLSIVKELTKVMGGKVKIFTKPNVGTIVAVSLQLDFCPDSSDLKENTKKRRIKKNSLAGRNVCIVEDQPFNREILETILRLEGANTLSFQDGSDLVQAAEEGSLNRDIDCFLLDVHMPILSGPETLIKLRQYEYFKDTPAFIVTADAIKSNLEQHLAGGYNLSGIFIKPLKRDDLVEALSGLPQL
ncbi:ATP-binding protein [Vibrio sp. F74]|uniref:PAS domain-containing hybrid sensor histidine kinase/response regulator n=1 Tax=Vibrio sp. F74 TaxID=700020 RepID=UPI0035F5B39E